MEKICKCPCHIDGADVIHAAPCCRFTYEKYISKNLEVDMQRYGALVEKAKKNLLIHVMSKHFKVVPDDIYDNMLNCLIETFNLGVERANLAARVIDDPYSYRGNTGSEYPPDQVVDRVTILKERIKV